MQARWTRLACAVFGPVRFRDSRGKVEASQVPGESAACVPCSLTPASPSYQVGTVARCCLPGVIRRRHSRVICLEARSHGPHARCLRFAAEVTLGPRKTRFRLVTSLVRTGFATRGTPLKVADSGHRSPSPGLPGAHHLHLLVEAESKKKLARALQG